MAPRVPLSMVTIVAPWLSPPSWANAGAADASTAIPMVALAASLRMRFMVVATPIPDADLTGPGLVAADCVTAAFTPSSGIASDVKGLSILYWARIVIVKACWPRDTHKPSTSEAGLARTVVSDSGMWRDTRRAPAPGPGDGRRSGRRRPRVAVRGSPRATFRPVREPTVAHTRRRDRGGWPEASG